MGVKALVGQPGLAAEVAGKADQPVGPSYDLGGEGVHAVGPVVCHVGFAAVVEPGGRAGFASLNLSSQGVVRVINRCCGCRHLGELVEAVIGVAGGAGAVALPGQGAIGVISVAGGIAPR